MKFLIVFVCALALALANEDANVIHNDAEVNVDSFRYHSELDNSVNVKQEGALKDHDTWVVKGSYEYVSPEGEHIQVSYLADENGYQPDSALLPTPHPIPEHIIKSIAYINAHPSKDAY